MTGTEARPNRREFLRAAGRWVVGGGLIAGVGVLAARPGRACDRGSLCGGCPLERGCSLPPALAARQREVGR